MNMWNEAQEAALKAFDDCIPTPMVVGQSSLFSGGIIPGTEEVVPDGVCGFAWINIKPARGPLVKFLKERGYGNRGVYGGYTLSFYEICPSRRGSQSMEKKIAACRAFVEVVKKYFPEMNIRVESRMD